MTEQAPHVDGPRLRRPAPARVRPAAADNDGGHVLELDPMPLARQQHPPLGVDDGNAGEAADPRDDPDLIDE